jgi:HD-GYP domain-containing protein (c-di-GMP phosphodiesterase class II)
MSLTTQILALYVTVAVAMLGLLYPFLLPQRSRLLTITSVYRPWSLVFLLLHCLLTLSLVVAPPVVLPISSVTIVGAITMLLLEVRSQRQPVPRVMLPVSFVALAALAMFAIWKTDFGRQHQATPLVFVVLVVALLGWASVEIYRNCRRRPSAHLMLAFLLGLLGIATILLRVLVTARTGVTVVNSTAAEPPLLFLTRTLFPVLLCLISITLNNGYLEQLWRREADSRKDAEQNLLSTLSALAKTRDEETGNHIVRTRNYVRVLAQYFRERNQLESAAGSRDPVDVLYQVAPLHDIGKIGIPDHILLKPGRLDPDEWAVMKTHAMIGENVLGAAGESGGDHVESEFHATLIRTAIEIAGGHHENWDGSGYPRGLAGTAIPQSARLMSLADTYDALISVRPYKRAWSHEEARTELLRLEGSKFDPAVIAAFLALETEFRDIATRYAD